MALVTFREILPQARKRKKAVGAFNIGNYETAAAVIRAAEQEKEPVIVQVYMRLFNSDFAYDLGGALLRLARRATVPVVLHLDHGNTFAQVENALQWGYTSVMLDGSSLPYEENVRETRRAAEAAHQAGATAEGEIGHVAMGDETSLTDPREAAEFAAATGVDALAVSIGTAHGYYKSEPKLDISRCAEIAACLPEMPLVLHGGSGTPLEKIRLAIENGIAKINIATEFQHTYLKAAEKRLRELQGKFEPVDKFDLPILDACADHVARLIRFFAGR